MGVDAFSPPSSSTTAVPLLSMAETRTTSATRVTRTATWRGPSWTSGTWAAGCSSRHRSAYERSRSSMSTMVVLHLGPQPGAGVGERRLDGAFGAAHHRGRLGDVEIDEV